MPSVCGCVRNTNLRAQPKLWPPKPQPSSSMVRDSLPQWLEAEIGGLSDGKFFEMLPWSIIVPNLPLCTRQSGLLREALAEPMWQVGDLGVYDVRRERSPSEEMSGKLCSLFQDLNGELFVV